MRIPETYKRKPLTVQAIRWMGDNADAVQSFIGYSGLVKVQTVELFATNGIASTATKGDWIVRTERGNFVTMKPNVFEEVYERA